MESDFTFMEEEMLIGTYIYLKINALQLVFLIITSVKRLFSRFEKIHVCNVIFSRIWAMEIHAFENFQFRFYPSSQDLKIPSIEDLCIVINFYHGNAPTWMQNPQLYKFLVRNSQNLCTPHGFLVSYQTWLHISNGTKTKMKRLRNVRTVREKKLAMSPHVCGPPYPPKAQHVGLWCFGADVSLSHGTACGAHQSQ